MFGCMFWDPEALVGEDKLLEQELEEGKIRKKMH